MSLLNKVAIVTGASSGIGAAIAIKLTEEGARVAIVGRNAGKIQAVSEICEQRGAKPLTIIADVTKDEDVKKIITATVNYFGKLDILINNAGIGNSGNITNEDAMQIFDKVISTNLRSAVYMTHLAVEHLSKTKGNILNISSMASQTVLTKTASAYCTSKAALDHFTRCMAFELSDKGIRVNAVNPGPVNTNIVENTGAPDVAVNRILNMMQNATFFKKMADPEEVADLVAFVVSDKGKSITGSTILTDNGSSLLGPWMK